jgi:hypothetical protein
MQPEQITYTGRSSQRLRATLARLIEPLTNPRPLSSRLDECIVLIWSDRVNPAESMGLFL